MHRMGCRTNREQKELDIAVRKTPRHSQKIVRYTSVVRTPTNGSLILPRRVPSLKVSKVLLPAVKIEYRS